MNKKGFTLIELLVVIAIIGLLSTIAVVALNSARSKSRDAKRIADVKQIQTALELAFAETNGYPIAADPGVVLGSATYDLLCNNNGAAVFQGDNSNCSTIFMSLIPANPTPGGSGYTYISADGTDYTLTFTLEGTVGSLTQGLVTASPGGMTK